MSSAGTVPSPSRAASAGAVPGTGGRALRWRGPPRPLPPAAGARASSREAASNARSPVATPSPARCRLPMPVRRRTQASSTPQSAGSRSLPTGSPAPSPPRPGAPPCAPRPLRHPPASPAPSAVGRPSLATRRPVATRRPDPVVVLHRVDERRNVSRGCVRLRRTGHDVASVDAERRAELVGPRRVGPGPGDGHGGGGRRVAHDVGDGVPVHGTQPGPAVRAEESVRGESVKRPGHEGVAGARRCRRPRPPGPRR